MKTAITRIQRETGNCVQFLEVTDFRLVTDYVNITDRSPGYQLFYVMHRLHSVTGGNANHAFMSSRTARGAARECWSRLANVTWLTWMPIQIVGPSNKLPRQWSCGCETYKTEVKLNKRKIKVVSNFVTFCRVRCAFFHGCQTVAWRFLPLCPVLSRFHCNLVIW